MKNISGMEMESARVDGYKESFHSYKNSCLKLSSATYGVGINKISTTKNPKKAINQLKEILKNIEYAD